MSTIMPLWPSPNYSPGPISQIQPFTYQDDVTYLDILYKLRDYINNTVVPHVNDLSDEVDAQITAMLTAVQAAIDAQNVTVTAQLAAQNAHVDAVLTAQTTSNDQKIAQLTTYVNDQVAQIIGSSVHVQDPVMQGIIQDPASQSRVALDALYAPHSDHDVIATGRLSPSSLDKKYKLYENVVDYGAVGDGVADDTAALQAAINAAAVSGRSVFLAGGTYRIVKPAGLDYFLELKAGVHIVGAGTIKVSNNAGDYRAIFAGAAIGTDLSNVALVGITVDENTANNPVGSFQNFPRYILCAFAGSNITVRDCTFLNIDSINAITINGLTVFNAVIVNNSFRNVGQSATVHDHSTVYISGQGMTITGNVFEGVAGGGGATTAIETHGGRQIVANNRVNNYYCGANITGINAQGSSNVNVNDNVLTNVLIGIDLWSQSPGTGLKNVIISDNNILLNRDIWIRGVSDHAIGIMLNPAMDQGITGLHIVNNVIDFIATAVVQASELLSAGISLWEVTGAVTLTGLRIAGNTIRNPHAEGIRLSVALDRAVIEDNYILNPATTPDPTLPSFYQSGITIIDALKNVKIANNRIHDTRTPHVIQQAIMTSVTSADHVYTSRNRVTCADGTVITPVTVTAGSGKTFLLDESMDLYAAQGWAKVGSKMFDEATGNTYVQTAAPDGLTWAQRAL